MPQPTQPAGPPFVIEPTAAHTRSLILLHGLGSNGQKFGEEFLETGKTSAGLTLPRLFPGAKFIFPTSRRRRSTAFGRSMLTMWFDIVRLQDPSHRKELQLQGLAESARELLDLVRQELETSNIPPENIVIGGLSQGCAMSLSVLLCMDRPIGGFIGMSGYLPFREDIDEAVAEPVDDEDDPFSRDHDAQDELDPATKAYIFERDLLGLPPMDSEQKQTAQSTPIFLGHGSADEKVPYLLGKHVVGTMQSAGYEVQWKCYQGHGHWYKIPDEIDDIVDFLRSVVGWQVENAE